MLALSKRNTNAAEIILFLHRLVQVLVEYFKELEEESIRDNFVIIYELMDEMMDFGYPQTTESKILQEYVSHTSLFPFLVRTQDAPRACSCRPSCRHASLSVVISVPRLAATRSQLGRGTRIRAVPSMTAKLSCHGVVSGRSESANECSLGLHRLTVRT